MRSLVKLAFAGLSLSVAVALGAGCAADVADEDGDEVSAEDAIRAGGITPGTFKLYPEPNAQPNANCDVHTSLTLSNTSGARAALREVVGGLCEIYVAPNERQYRLRLDSTSCGSKIFKGRKRIGGKTHEITVTDHRTRICEDIVPAKIIVDEAVGADRVTKYSYDAPPVAPVGQWLTIAPKQCGTNPWSGAQAGADPSSLQGEDGEVDNFFRQRGIGLELVGFGYPAEARMVCMECSCPRGDSLLVKAKTPADAQRLVSEFGFAQVAGALSTSPKQCGTNPWDEAANRADESRNLATWAKGAGAPLESAGFLSYTEPRMVCMACSCPRGDVALAFPETEAAGATLETLGWAPLAN